MPGVEDAFFDLFGSASKALDHALGDVDWGSGGKSEIVVGLSFLAGALARRSVPCCARADVEPVQSASGTPGGASA
jgi:hypothetical protein